MDLYNDALNFEWLLYNYVTHCDTEYTQYHAFSNVGWKSGSDKWSYAC